MAKNILLIWDWINEDVFLNKDINYHYLYLFKNRLEKIGLSVTTINKNEDTIDIYFNKLSSETKNESFLVIREPQCIMPFMHETINYTKFTKIFTWNDDLVNNKNIIKLNCIQTPIITNINNSWEKFCCMISSNKFSFHKDELYSERRKAVQFFEKYYPNEFDLFWTRWNKFFYPFNTSIQSIFKKDFSLSKIFVYIYIILLKNNYKIYRWRVDDKFKTLSKYRFSICFENQRWTNWYITEKIWDCFFSWSIPIYLWADNITDYIPANCFIDMRKYFSYEELYIHMKSLSNDEIEWFKNNISNFLSSEKINEYHPEHWSDVIIKNIQWK